MRVQVGFPFLGLLGLLFIALKLTGHIADWSWWLVLAPLWLPLGVVVLLFVIAAATALESAARRGLRRPGRW